MTKEERQGRWSQDPSIQALGHVSLYLGCMLLGGMFGSASVEALYLLWGRAGAYFFQAVRNASLSGLFVGAALGLPFSLALLILGSKGRGPDTWWGWSVAGFVMGVLPSAGCAWFPHKGIL